ncbi:helix-turn-helix transcriptional regulator [Cereibacter sphaeroides]|uniref:helix-turn-helix transcriptional regulator n=1 Tax=Cereibacter sphaeroides TaxID=1063 RepID=UPI001F317B45|nr:autoinducer binding domain-containing protein [Cereibacter sphaeroides]MCE6967174.1 autoinducer binding domain-containing protein [Cereibacter sphaeroides]
MILPVPSATLTDHTAFFRQLAPAGAYVGLRIGFYAPEEEINLFPASWVVTYTARNFALKDPLTCWAAANEETRRWSAIDAPDPAGVMAEYRRHGLRFGVVVSLGASVLSHRRRSFGVFARSDREMSDAEIQELRDRLAELHEAAVHPLTATQIEVLQLMTDGIRYKEMAFRLGISEAAIKARLKGACAKLGARTPVQAANIALTRGLLRA